MSVYEEKNLATLELFAIYLFLKLLLSKSYFINSGLTNHNIEPTPR